jgi:hypothetical protein
LTQVRHEPLTKIPWDAVIRGFDSVGNVIEMDEHKADFKD